MKAHIKFTFLFLIISFFSCKSIVDENEKILGIWDYIEKKDGEKRTYSLVFGREQMGMSINRVDYDDGEVTSSVKAFEWIKKSDTITIEKDEIFLLNSKGQLESQEFKNLVLYKVSNDYSKYLGN